MALDMFTTNKTAVLTMIEKFKDSLEKLENMIRDGKVKEITAELEKAKELRAGMYAVKS
ncbi:MAG: prephenate dehydrogenase dimerization domain-containing protein [Candidatus Margulisiibacteriota bacterium]